MKIYLSILRIKFIYICNVFWIGYLNVLFIKGFKRMNVDYDIK